MNVHILATCRKPELLKFTTLVFASLRTGFPTAKVHVHFNRLKDAERDALYLCAEETDCETSSCDTIHHEWIEQLVNREQEPFWLLDTDVVFYDSFESHEFDEHHLAGWRIPEWFDEFSGCITRARLHTSLLYVNPRMVRSAIADYESRIAHTVFTPKANPFYPLVAPFKRKAYFYDTCSLLYHAIGGEAFTDSQKERYCHLNFGTIPDIVFPRLPKEDVSRIEQARQCVLSNPSWGKGAWRHQEEFYSKRQP